MKSKRKKEKIRVYVQRPWKFGDSSYYKNIFKNPPKEIKYLNANKEKQLIQSAKAFKINTSLKQNIKKIIKKIFPSMPNAHKSPKKDYDLIHCAHCLSKNKKKPWICDIETISQLWAGPKEYGTYTQFDKINQILLRENCKKILPWTEWVKKDILKFFPEVKNKIEVLPFAMPLPKLKNKKSKKIMLLFSSRRFYFKGGLYAIEVIDYLTKKYENVEGIIVSDVPKEVLDKYSKNKKIKFYGLINQKRLFHGIYPKANIFIYPSWKDTYGFGFVEALAFGLPVIGIQGYSNKELIKEGETGFIVPKEKNLKSKKIDGEGIKILEKLIKKTEILINNKKLRERMGKNGRKEVAQGKFSIKQRNKSLKKIYGEALK